MNQQSEHLSNAQIEAYGERTSGAGPEQDERNKGQRVDAHLDDCPSCRARVLDFQRTRLAPQADPQVKQAPTPDCPSEDTLRQLAAGLCSDAMATKLIHHAATCDHCGPLLRAYTEDFSDDFSPEEEAVLSDLKSSSVAWQKDTARKMLAAADTDTAGASAGDLSTGTPTSSPRATPEEPSGAPLAKPDRKLFSWKWVFVPATAAAVAATAAVVICGAVGFGIWYARRDTPEKVEKLLAQAYTEQRTMEMRLPGAAYAPITPPERGPISLQSHYLFEAKAKTIRKLREKPEDPKWLHALGREEMIEGQTEPAIRDLQHAFQLNPNSTDLMIDLAGAHYERARRTGSAKDYGQALELLGKVLTTQPDNLTALFNRALLYQRMSPPIYGQALEDWNHYLQLDSNSAWSTEAKQRKDEIEQIKKKSQSTNP